MFSVGVKSVFDVSFFWPVSARFVSAAPTSPLVFGSNVSCWLCVLISPPPFRHERDQFALLVNHLRLLSFRVLFSGANITSCKVQV